MKFSDEEEQEQEIRTDFVLCLGGCNKKFWSRDRASNRVCPGCTRRLEKVSPPRVVRVGTLQTGRPVNPPVDD